MTIIAAAHRDSQTNSASVGPRYSEEDFGLQIGLQSHQYEGVDWLLAPGHERCLVADEVGLGKTAMVIGAITALIAASELPHVGRHRLARVLWLTDVNLIEQTVKEFERFASSMGVLSATPTELNTKRWQTQREAEHPQGADVLVMGIEAAHSRRDWLSRHQFSMLVVDEAGSLRGGGAIWKTVREMARGIPRVVGMTATPMENHPVELFNVLDAIGTPGLWQRRDFETHFVEWTQKINRSTGQPYDRRPAGWLHEEAAATVRSYLPGIMLRRTADQVSLQLPINVTAEPVIWVEPYVDQQYAYDRASRWGNQAQAFHAQQKAGLSAGESSAILDRLMQLLRERGDQQAIVFSEYVDLLSEIADRLERADLTHVVIQGSVKDKDRQAAVETFTSEQARVLVGNVVLERGLNLQNCNLLISVGTSWNPAREAQREGRIRRAGSPHQTYEHITLMPATQLSEAQWSILSRKREHAVSVGL